MLPPKYQNQIKGGGIHSRDSKKSLIPTLRLPLPTNSQQDLSPAITWYFSSLLPPHFITPISLQSTIDQSSPGTNIPSAQKSPHTFQLHVAPTLIPSGLLSSSPSSLSTLAQEFLNLTLISQANFNGANTTGNEWMKGVNPYDEVDSSCPDEGVM